MWNKFWLVEDDGEKEDTPSGTMDQRSNAQLPAPQTKPRNKEDQEGSFVQISQVSALNWNNNSSNNQLMNWLHLLLVSFFYPTKLI